MKRIHIVGAGPRTGTTLMAEMAIACFKIDLYTEHEDNIYTLPSRKAEIFLTKKPRDILVVGPMLWAMPDLYIIYMLRDPRDSITSKHRKDPQRYWAGLRYWKTYTIYGEKLQNHPRFITIRYEDLVTKPDEVQAKLIEKMPFLEKVAPFSRYHEVAKPSDNSLKALGSLRPIGPGSVGKWRKHLPRVAGQLQKHGSIAEDLIKYGYEQDSTWLKELENVTPDLSESRWPEYFTPEELRQRMRGKYIFPILTRMGLMPLYKLLREWIK
ncbi:MAG: sulfotransferase [Prochloraceae cyanobacterium]